MIKNKNFAKGYSSSRFWMGDYATRLDSGKDVVQMSIFQKAISNFVRITTGKEIPVRYQTKDSSYTDGKSVTISSKIDDKLFDVTVGLALHEASHVLLTDFTLLHDLMAGTIASRKDAVNYAGKYESSITALWRELFKRLPKEKQDASTMDSFVSVYRNYLKNVLNIVEDRRIDMYIYNNAPGYRGYYQAMYGNYFNAESIDLALKHQFKNEPTIDNYMFYLCNITNRNLNLNSLPKLRRLYEIIDLHNIERLKTTGDAFAVSLDVMEVLMDELVAKMFPEDSAPKKLKSQDTNSDTESGDDQLGDTPGQPGDDDSDMDSSAGGDDNEDEDTDTDTDDEDNDSEGGGSEDEDDEVMDSEGAGAKAEIPASALKKIERGLEKAIEKQKEFLEGNVKKGTVSRKEAQELEAISNSDIDLVDVNSSSDDLPYQRHNGKIKCIVVNALDASFCAVRGGAYANPIANYVLHNTNIIERYRPVNPLKKGWRNSYEEGYDAIVEGIALGKILGKKLKLRNESNELNTTRLRDGKIDKRLIAEIGYGAEAVFSRLQVKSVKPVLIHYSIDASGSMTGSKFQTSLKSAAAIAKAASLIKGVDVIISFRCTAHINSIDYPVMLIGYDSRKNSIQHLLNYMSKVSANSSTPEGLCFEAVLDHMKKSIRNNTEGIFLNISDGEPVFSTKGLSYSGDYAIAHTRKQVNSIRNMGYKVLSYFVTDHEGSNRYANRNFSAMYGADASFVDVNQVNQLAGTLNNIMLQPVSR